MDSGEIDDAEFFRRNRRELEKDHVKGTGTWWPRYLKDCRAIEIINGQVQFVVIDFVDIYETNEKGTRTGKSISVPIFHRELYEWIREEQRKEMLDVQFAGIIQDQPAEEEKWISELF